MIKKKYKYDLIVFGATGFTGKLVVEYLLKKTNEESNKQLLTCFNKRWGCCDDNYTPKLDIFGSNCRGF